VEGDEEECNLEIEEDDDVPHHKDKADLQKWLKLSDQHLAALHTSAAPTRRGNYHSSKVGQDVSKRRQQALQKEEKERSAREQKEDLLGGVKPTKIQDFFSRASRAPPVVPASKPTIELLDIEHFEPMDIDSPSKLATEEPEMGGNVVDEASDLDLDLAPSPEPSSTSPLHRVTVEDVDDEEILFLWNHGSLVPKQWQKRVWMNYLGTPLRKFFRGKLIPLRFLRRNQPGKKREGYQTAQDIIDQSTRAMDILVLADGAPNDVIRSTVPPGC
jgi:hypothetical protein